MMLEGQIKQIFHPRKQPTFNITEIQKCTSSVRFIFELFVVRLHFFMSITRRLHFWTYYISLTFNFNSLLYFKAHRALADVQAMRNVLFCTELKDVVSCYEPLLRTALEQKRKYKAMVQTRERSKSLLLKLGTTLSGNMARKVASEGFTFADLQNLRGRFQEKEQFVQSLRAKGLSLLCCRKLAGYFYEH